MGAGLISRREVLRGIAAAAGLVAGGAVLTGTVLGGTAAPARAEHSLGAGTTGTLEAYADTVVPGAKRHPGDHPVAGAAAGPGAVHAGALDLLTMPAVGLAPLLPTTAVLVNVQATAYALTHGVRLPLDRPPLVGLPFEHRTGLLRELVAAGRVDRMAWVGLAYLAGLAFDAAAHTETAEAVRAGHPGLGWLGFFPPDPDGLWRFPAFSYARQLADPHPATTPTGNPP